MAFCASGLKELLASVLPRLQLRSHLVKCTAQHTGTKGRVGVSQGGILCERREGAAGVCTAQAAGVCTAQAAGVCTTQAAGTASFGETYCAQTTRGMSGWARTECCVLGLNKVLLSRLPSLLLRPHVIRRAAGQRIDRARRRHQGDETIFSAEYSVWGLSMVTNQRWQTHTKNRAQTDLSVMARQASIGNRPSVSRSPAPCPRHTASTQD